MAEFFFRAFEEAGFDSEIRRAGKKPSCRHREKRRKPASLSLPRRTYGYGVSQRDGGKAAVSYPGRLRFGPGTVDMKAGALLILYIARRASGKLHRRFRSASC